LHYKSYQQDSISLGMVTNRPAILGGVSISATT
jgi:hypothetical protein